MPFSVQWEIEHIFLLKGAKKSLIFYPGIPTLNPGIPGGPKPSGIPGFRDPGNPDSKHYQANSFQVGFSFDTLTGYSLMRISSAPWGNNRIA